MRPERGDFYPYDAQVVRMCQLKDGRILEYDLSSSEPDAYDAQKFEMIGTGIVYTINGVRQTVGDSMYFYRRIA